MNALLNQLHELNEEELYAVCEAIEQELQRREVLAAAFSESARRRANEREQSYRRRNGAHALPVRAVGIDRSGTRRAA